MRLSWNDKRFPFNNKGSSELHDIISMLGPGLGQILAGNDYMGNPKKADLPAAAALPDPNKAAQDALDAQNKDRRALLASGGRTDLTAGSGMLLGSDIHSLNLGGS